MFAIPMDLFSQPMHIIFFLTGRIYFETQNVLQYE